MQLFKIRVKDRQGIVVILKYTLLSSIILKSPHPAYLPSRGIPRSSNLETLHHRPSTWEAVCRLSGVPTILCTDGRTFEVQCLTVQIVAMTSVNPKLVHNTWYKKYLCIFWNFVIFSKSVWKDCYCIRTALSVESILDGYSKIPPPEKSASTESHHRFCCSFVVRFLVWPKIIYPSYKLWHLMLCGRWKFRGRDGILKISGILSLGEKLTGTRSSRCVVSWACVAQCHSFGTVSPSF